MLTLNEQRNLLRATYIDTSGTRIVQKIFQRNCFFRDRREIRTRKTSTKSRISQALRSYFIAHGLLIYRAPGKSNCDIGEYFRMRTKLQHARQGCLSLRRKRISQGLFFPGPGRQHPDFAGRCNGFVTQRDSPRRRLGSCYRAINGRVGHHLGRLARKQRGCMSLFPKSQPNQAKGGRGQFNARARLLAQTGNASQLHLRFFRRKLRGSFAANAMDLIF